MKIRTLTALFLCVVSFAFTQGEEPKKLKPELDGL
ncbi:hypothetical protein BH23VER1_BH23VER1_33700 [soil metagenome]